MSTDLVNQAHRFTEVKKPSSGRLPRPGCRVSRSGTVSRDEVNIKVSCYPDTDSLFIESRPGVEAEGSEIAPGIVFHYTSKGEIAAIDIDSEASKLVDLFLLEGLSPTGHGGEVVTL